MKFHARKMTVMMVPVDPDTFRMPKPEDRFVIKLTTDTRQYMVANVSCRPSPMYRVQFAVSDTGTRLAACECADFKNIRVHGRQCKHIHAAYNLHVSRMQAAAKAAREQAVCI